MQNRKPSRLVLFAINLYSGLGTMAFEMVLGRALVPYFGGTIYTWGALIAVFLFGMSVGFYGGGKIADRYPRMTMLGVLLLACGVTITLTPTYSEQLCLALLDAIEDVRYGALMASFAMAFLPALLFAATSPIAVRLALKDVEHSGAVVGTMSALNTAGSIVGTVATSFFLVPLLGSRAILLVLGTVTLALGFLIFVSAGGHRRMFSAKLPHVFCALTVGLGLVLASTAPPVLAQQSTAISLLTKDGIIESVESEYNNIHIIKRGRLLYMNFGYRGSEYVESLLDLNDPNSLPATYTRYMTLGTLYAEKLERGAFVGLGGGRTANYLVQNFPTLNLEIAELDPEVIRLASKYFGIQQTNRLRVTPQDGRIYLTRSKLHYDIVFLDAYRGPFVPFHLLTKEFFQLIKKRLVPNGVVVQNVEPTTMVLDSAIVTVGTVFQNVETFEAGGNVVIVAYDGTRVTDEKLQARAKAITSERKLRYDLTTLLKSRRSIEPVRGTKVLTDDFAPVEMLHTIKRHNQKRL